MLSHETDAAMEIDPPPIFYALPGYAPRIYPTKLSDA